MVDEQVVLQVGVDAFGEAFALVVEHAMVATSEHRHRINVCFAQGTGKLLGIEFASDIANQFTGMEIQMNLPHTHTSPHCEKTEFTVSIP